MRGKRPGRPKHKHCLDLEFVCVRPIFRSPSVLGIYASGLLVGGVHFFGGGSVLGVTRIDTV